MKIYIINIFKIYSFYIEKYIVVYYNIFIIIKKEAGYMIIDVTGIELTPENGGRDCKGNGFHYDENGELLECCCNECDYAVCCLEDAELSLYSAEFYGQIDCKD